MTVASALAAFVTQSSYADLPSTAVDYSAMMLSSVIASAALGSTIESTQIVRALEVERGGRPEATVWFGAAEKLPVAAAARVNALASDAAASDDSDLRNIVHHGTTVCATALALGERAGASGRDMLTAIVLGYEVAGQISTAIQCGHKPKGFHGCIIASLGGAATAARLMQLSETQTTHAIALAATSVGGLSAAANTSLAREYHAGLAAMLGVQAAQAAARGYTAEDSIFETKDGFLAVYGDKADPADVTRDLGKIWNILTNMGIKLVPGGHPNHAVAEAAANAAREGNVFPEQVESINISRPGYQGFANPSFPTDLIGIAHSAGYFAAAGVADRDYNWTHAFADKINDPVIRGLLSKVRMIAPPTENLERYKSGAIVTINTKNGRSYAYTVYAPKGAAILGITWRDVAAKYRALVPYAKLSGSNLETSLAVIQNLREVKTMSELVNLLR